MCEERRVVSGVSKQSDTLSLETIRGDGLPCEIWRIIFSYLSVKDLCRCCQVCQSWQLFMTSLDKTAWKDHFLSSHEWKHPLWPRYESDNLATSWQKLYREHYLASRLWLDCRRQLHQSNCLHVLRRRTLRKTIRVGPECESKTLKNALSVAGNYDRILIMPGVYDEQFEMSAKIPFELIGCGKLGDVVLVTCVEQNALTGRLCNLVLIAPWFTNHVLKISSGHLQLDNCIIESGQVIVQSPGTCHFRYCTFRQPNIRLQHVSLSIIENSEFTDSDGSAIYIDGHPKEEENWAWQHMSRVTSHHSLSARSSVSDLLKDNSELELDISESVCCDESSTVDSIGVASILGGSRTTITESCSSDSTSFFSGSVTNRQVPMELPPPFLSTGDGESYHLGDDVSSVDDSSTLQQLGSQRQMSSPWSGESDLPAEMELSMSFKYAIEREPSLQQLYGGISGCVIRNCRIANSPGGITVCRQGQARIEDNELCHLNYGIRCLQNAKVAILENDIHHCTTSGIYMRLAAHGLIASNDIYCTNEAAIDVRKHADPIIQCNRLHHSKRSGIVVLGGGCGIIKANDIYQNREAGIYIVYRGNPYVIGNRVCHGGAAGIAVNEDGKGYIIENYISANRWGGIDIRHNSNPHVVKNIICNGLADGIVVGSKGRGILEGNTVKGNMGCGVLVMGGQPLIQMNQIYHNLDTGVSYMQNKDGGGDYSGDEADDSASEPSLDVDLPQETSATLTSRPNSSSTSSCQPTLKYNTIYHNNGYGILADSNQTLHLSDNAIHANRNVGIYLKQSSPVVILNNSITGNTGSGLVLVAQSKATVEGNGIYDNQGNGLSVYGEASVCNNDIFSNQQSALCLTTGATVKVEKNRIHAPSDHAVIIQSGVRGLVNDNRLYSGDSDFIKQDDVGGCQVESNVMITEEISREDGEKQDWHLENPPPRPHQDPPPIIVPKSPVPRVTTVSRVTVPSGGSCQQGSRLCCIM